MRQAGLRDESKGELEDDVKRGGKSTARPCCIAGVKRICCAAWMDSSSKPCPKPFKTPFTFTSPEA